MDYFKLTLPWRLVLAVLSAVIPTILAMYPIGYLGIFVGTNFAPYGAFLGALVMVPFITARNFRFARIILMIVAGSLWVSLTVWASGKLSGLYGSASVELLLSVLAGTVLLSISTVFFAGLKISVRLIMHAAMAGFASGLVFNFMLEHWHWLCFDDCKWWNNWLFAAAWVFWHVSILAAIFRGAGVGPSAEFDARPSST